MKYMGSKSRIASTLVPVVNSIIQESGLQQYVEPFVGGANVIDKISSPSRAGFDNHKYLIALYQNISEVPNLPTKCSREHYVDVRTSYNLSDGRYPDWYVGAIGFLASYNGRFFDGGYSGVVKTKAGTTRDYYHEAKSNLIKQIPNLENIQFECADYRELAPTKSVIYCDPPYEGVKQYGSSRDFNHSEFWDWARSQRDAGNVVLVSEHQAPPDFKLLLEINVKRTIDNTKRVKATERLFRLGQG